MKICFYQTAFLGDLLLAVPTLKRIKEWQPGAAVTLICRRGLGELMQTLPFVDRVVEVDKKNQGSLKQLGKILASEDFDYYFSPHYSFRSHFLSLKVKAKCRIGFHFWWNWMFFDKRVKRPMNLPDALRQMSLLSIVDEITKKRLKPYLNSSNLSTVDAWADMSMDKSFWTVSPNLKKLIPGGRFICLAPGSVWPTKRWKASGFIEVGRHFRDEGYEIFVMGSPEESDLCQQVSEACGATNLAGKLSLLESVIFLSRAQLLISNDSGAQHMASLAATPTVSVFGPTVIGLGYRPWQSKARIVEHDLPCRPCGKHGGKTCPLGTHECMESINSPEVISEATHLLSQ